MDLRIIAIVCALIFGLTGSAPLTLAQDTRTDFNVLNPNATPWAIIGADRFEAIKTTPQ